MVFEDFVGIRYLMAKRDRNMLSVITLISVGGVAVGVMALIVVLSVMGGFEADFREKITGSKAHVVISAKDGYIENYEEIRAIALKTDRVEGANGYVEAEVMLNSPTNLQAAILRGIDYREIVTTTKLGDYIEEGKLEYLEDPDALPSISMVGSVVQRGTLSIQSDTEDGGLTDEKVDRLEQAGARAAIAFAGDKHGAWIAKGSQEIELPAGVETAPETVVGDANSPQNAEHNADDLTKNGDIYDLPDVDPIAPMPRRRSAADVGNNATDGDLSPELLAAIGEDRWIDSESSPTVRQPAAMGDAQAGATQYDREPNAVLLPQNKRTRTMKAMPGLDGSDSSRRVGAIILGRELKNNLTLYLGGELNIMSPSGDVGPAGNLPKSRPFKVVGSYYSGMFEYDAKMAYISLADAQAFWVLGMP